MSRFHIASCLAAVMIAAAPIAHCADFLPSGARFSVTSTMKEAGSGGNYLIKAPFEEGVMDDVTYYIYANGRAQSGDWQIYCDVDAMTDARTCIVNRGAVWVAVDKRGVASVVVGDKHTPGTTVNVRIDGAAAMSSSSRGWTGKDAEKIVAAASKGTKIHTRYTRWPDSAPTDDFTYASGFSGAIRIAKWMVTPTSPK